jgi:DNA repair protein SbcD/Mre11
LTDPIRVLHFADLHIGMENFGRIDPATGVNQRVIDFTARLKEIVSYAIEEQADLVVFAGDAFKTRDPNPTVLREFARQIMRLSKADVPVVLLVGNHDMPLMEKRANSVDIFRTLDVANVIVGHSENVHVIETRRGKVQVATAPWPARARLVANDEGLRARSVDELDRELERLVADELQRLASEIDPALPAILTGHFTVSGAKFGSERSVMIGRDAVISLAAINNPAWDYVALGHIHKHQELNQGGSPPVVYSGSLERIDFGEADDPKGFVWVELARGNTRWRFVPLAVRPFVSIHVDATRDLDTPTDAVLRAIAQREISGAIVRVQIKLDEAQVPHLRLRDIDEALADAHFVAGIGRDVQRSARVRLGLENPETKTPLELLDAYLRSKSIEPERASALMTLARDIIKE